MVIFAIFTSQSLWKFSLQYMLYNNEKSQNSASVANFPPSPKSQKYLYTKYMAYTVHCTHHLQQKLEL